MSAFFMMFENLNRHFVFNNNCTTMLPKQGGGHTLNFANIIGKTVHVEKCDVFINLLEIVDKFMNFTELISRLVN